MRRTLLALSLIALTGCPNRIDTSDVNKMPPVCEGAPDPTGIVTSMERDHSYQAPVPDFVKDPESPFHGFTQQPPAGSPVAVGETVGVTLTRDGDACRLFVKAVASPGMQPVSLVQENPYGRPELYPGEKLEVAFDPPADAKGNPWKVTATVDGKPVESVAAVEQTPMGPGLHRIEYTLTDGIGRTRTFKTTRYYRHLALYRDVRLENPKFGCRDTEQGAVLSMNGTLASERFRAPSWANIQLTHLTEAGPRSIVFGVGESGMSASPAETGAAAERGLFDLAWEAPPLHTYREAAGVDPTQWSTWPASTCGEIQGLQASIFGLFQTTTAAGLVPALFEIPTIRIKPDGQGGWTITTEPREPTVPPPTVPQWTKANAVTTTESGCICRLDLIPTRGRHGKDKDKYTFFSAFASGIATGSAYSFDSSTHTAGTHTPEPDKTTARIVCTPKPCAKCCPKPMIRVKGKLEIADALAQVSSLGASTAWVHGEQSQTGDVVNAVLANGTAAGAQSYTYASGYKIGGEISGTMKTKEAEASAKVSGEYNSQTTYTGGTHAKDKEAGRTVSTQGSTNACEATQRRSARGEVGAMGEYHYFWANDTASADLGFGSNSYEEWEFSCGG